MRHIWAKKKHNLLMKIRRDPCWDGYVTDPRRNSCMTSKMMGEVLIAQQHYLPSERKGLLQLTQSTLKCLRISEVESL